MATFSFGPEVTESGFVRDNFEEIVRRLTVQARSPSADSLKKVYTSLSQLGLNLKSLPKDHLTRMFIEAAFILIQFQLCVYGGLVYHDVGRLLENYPSFVGLDAKELNTLLQYRNYMAIAVKFLRADINRDHLLKLIPRLTEGAEARYVGGRGATRKTRDRLAIFWKEGNVIPKPRPPRDPSKTSLKRKRSDSPPTTKTDWISKVDNLLPLLDGADLTFDDLFDDFTVPSHSDTSLDLDMSFLDDEAISNLMN